jgi:hypothetical protein
VHWNKLNIVERGGGEFFFSKLAFGSLRFEVHQQQHVMGAQPPHFVIPSEAEGSAVCQKCQTEAPISELAAILHELFRCLRMDSSSRLRLDVVSGQAIFSSSNASVVELLQGSQPFDMILQDLLILLLRLKERFDRGLPVGKR